jgi:hypothetical protein
MLRSLLDLFPSFADVSAAFGRLSHGHLDGAGSVTVVVALCAGLLALLLAVAWLWRRASRKSRTSVTSRRAFTHAEGLLWARLSSALPEHVVLMAVPLTRFVTVLRAGGLGRNQRKLESLTVDFGVFRADGSVASVVILEDSNAELSRRQIKLRRKLLDRAGIKAVCWPLRPLPTAETIVRLLNPVAIDYSAGERGSFQRGGSRAAAVVIADSGFAPDTRLVASHANPDFRPA